MGQPLMTIHGSPWDKIKQVEEESAARIDRVDATISDLFAQLRALDARLVKIEEKKPVKKYRVEFVRVHFFSRTIGVCQNYS